MFLTRRLHLASSLMVLLLLPAGLALAADREQGAGLSPVVRARVERSLEIAARRLEELDSCRALFEPFGRDGRHLLRAARIVHAEHTPHARVCDREGVSLVTRVHGDTIGVCGNQLSRLPVQETAARLLHEVLHHAGMGERPHDPGGLFPEQITRRVKRACRL